MSDDLGPLRQALTDLSEYGGSADLYDRALRKSRQTQRRAAIAGGAAAAAVVFALGGTVAFAVNNRPGPSVPPAGPPSSAAPGGPVCPSIESVQDLIELPDDWSLATGKVECVETWAAVEAKRPGRENVRYLFHYTAATGWRYQDQGDSWVCKDLGLTQPAPFCTS